VSKLYIKICGIKDIKIAKYAIECGASFLGFVFFENSKRDISINTCSEILNEIDDKINTVAVTVNPTNDDLERYSGMKFTHLQLHGSESLDEVMEISKTFDFKIIKSFNISTESDFTNIENYSPFIDYILLDSKHKRNMPGGTGKTFNWELIRNFAPSKPFFLSGGLNIDNVSDAIKLQKTKYFDVSSGVENSDGIKDENLISEFISKANGATQ